MSASDAADPPKCQWCGNFHSFKCPMVKAMEYHDNGRMKRVEFFYSPIDYPKVELASGPITFTGNDLNRPKAT